MIRSLVVLALCSSSACSGRERVGPTEPSEATAQMEPSRPPASAAPASAPSPEPEDDQANGDDGCGIRVAALDAARDALLEPHRACRFSVDCRLATEWGCLPRCPSALHVSAWNEVADGLAGLHNVHCPELVEAECAPSSRDCTVVEARCVSERCAAVTPDVAYDEASVPAENDPERADAPARPEAGDAEERAARLLEAIVRDEPWRAADFFFPREAFRRVKAISSPDRYWEQLYARYEQDIHALHARFADVEPDAVHFERLEIVRRGGYVRRGEEANALPYWAARHNWLHYEQQGRPEKLEVRVLITWGERWYITHLSEFH